MKPTSTGKLPVFFKVKYHIYWSHCAFLNDFTYTKAYYHFGLASNLFFLGVTERFLTVVPLPHFPINPVVFILPFCTA